MCARRFAKLSPAIAKKVLKNSGMADESAIVQPPVAEREIKRKRRKRDRAEFISDSLLPHANLARVMRRALRPSTMLSNQAILATQVPKLSPY